MDILSPTISRCRVTSVKPGGLADQALNTVESWEGKLLTRGWLGTLPVLRADMHWVSCIGATQIYKTADLEVAMKKVEEAAAVAVGCTVLKV
jgi:hypothetical protein